MKVIVLISVFTLLFFRCLAQTEPVIVYDNTDFTGEQRALSAHWNPDGLSDVFNNRIGSMHIPDGTWVIVFEETGFRGQYLVIKDNWSAMDYYAAWNNNISSMLVLRKANEGIPVQAEGDQETAWQPVNQMPANTCVNTGNHVCSESHFMPDASTVPGDGVFFSLEAAMRHPEDVLVLDIRGQYVSEWPAFFSNMKNLQELYISDNNFSSWPSFFGDFNQLRVLVAANNQFTEFPPFFQNLKHLEVLNISGNPITSFCPFFQDLTALRELDISGTGITSFPAFFQNLKQLRHLNISGTAIDRFPAFFEELTQLHWMDITGTKITDLPYGVRSMNIVIVGRPD